jgi:DNA (cytosine-5)-methyltransferase 1
MLLLSLFPGIDLLGLGFELEGFCVVRGPDKLWGGDIRSFHPPPGRFNGIIGGSPCQDFSLKRRTPPTGEGVEMMRQFGRVVLESRAAWFLLENVPAAPDLLVEGYTIQRFDLNARECGLAQSRLRHFQFGSRDGLVISPHREKPRGRAVPICLASEGESTERRAWADFCELQGLPRDFELPGWSIAAKYRAVGNGVPVPVARVIARAIRDAMAAARGHRITERPRLCACRCGRILKGKQRAATPGCRKRLERARKCERALVAGLRTVTVCAVTICGRS